MFQQDFILRQIRQFTRVLEQVILKKREGKQEEARPLIHQTLNELTGDASGDFRELSLVETNSLFAKDGDFLADLALGAADLLFEDCNQNGYEQSGYQALLLYQKVMNHPDTPFPLEASDTVTQLKEQLMDIPKIKRIDDLSS